MLKFFGVYMSWVVVDSNDIRTSKEYEERQSVCRSCGMYK